MQNYIKEVIKNMPKDWLNLTTHRLDIYEEKLAKTQFLEEFINLYNNDISDISALAELPTAYDYIRLGHPLSCVLEWVVANAQQLSSENIISFDSKTMPILAILRKNLLENKKTRILYTDVLPTSFDVTVLKSVYGYEFELHKIEQGTKVDEFDGSTIFIQQKEHISDFNIIPNIDFFININTILGSILLVNGTKNESYISEIQHVRRRETIAMTPENCLVALQNYVGETSLKIADNNLETDKRSVLNSIQKVTNTTSKPLVASSGLSMQYAIMMGLIDDANLNHPKKTIKFIVPPNCYGGTNDQARRVAACIENVEIVDLPVDGENDMVQSIERILTTLADEDAVPYIIAEIPTNPRVEVPDLTKLEAVLSKKRTTKTGKTAIDPVFILDQTFCPNVHFLGRDAILSSIRAISYASGSKFPSGGKCTAGYCIVNEKNSSISEKIDLHLSLCENEATPQQYQILATQLPSMKQRIEDAYKNTLEFVNFIKEVLPAAKINFVSSELASQGFTPSVFSLDLPTKGNSLEEKESYKRALNLKLINLMITEIPDESKFCVSYGQLKGCYWTIPATSTQGTTKEGDKDYIVRTSMSPDLDLEMHKKVFLKFVESI
ncbi:cystathionine beta-synthase [Polaribacter reichenbachii]|uniref:Cystathionine beta-synthase n=2 Tax=Polaribacter reichenbachii TaxID=996801 RepID=A0A1B8TQ91_9FLAO|nr:PLP-dependent transferase [Polaribacter reichenbachii]APZ46854.1 cystathionine beta-synthase [Polaribacter reichenbachii]AUC17497.1 cystathionine beta-synthase [Polaribacter reichenbachii]OBY61628.1 cystathionine beta-synthase [Polaribacter reichenbachii]